jgi:rubrerythrin
MDAEYEERVRALSPSKALAIAAYGESVAAYRYRILAQKTSSEQRRALFSKIADEEQHHHTLVQDELERQFPGSDFVLTPEDKELVVVGPRMIDVADRVSLKHAFELMYQSERLTGKFYATLHETTTVEALKPLLESMANECLGHAERIRQMPEGD